MNISSPLADYWKEHALASLYHRYKDRVLAKMPEDLHAYQHILWETKPDTIVELGTFEGGSAVWFLDQLRAMTSTGSVITVDLVRRGPDLPLGIRAIVGDLADPATVGAVRAAIAPGARTMVVDDSGHTYQTTSAALAMYHDLVSPGCYFVVEDTIVENEAICPQGWYAPGTVVRAIDDFLAAASGFERVHLDDGVTSNHGGWLRRL